MSATNRHFVGTWRANTGSIPKELADMFKVTVQLTGQNYVVPDIHVLMRNGSEYSGRFGGESLWLLEDRPSDIILWRYA